MNRKRVYNFKAIQKERGIFKLEIQSKKKKKGGGKGNIEKLEKYKTKSHDENKLNYKSYEIYED